MTAKFLRRGAVAIASAAFLLLASGARADGIYIQVPAPRILLPAPPPMVWLPSIGIYVAHESPQAIFFLDGDYYVRDHGVWFASRVYGGPWARVDVMRLPPPLRGYHDRDWGRYQREARSRYRRDDDRMHPMFYPGHPGRGRFENRDYRRGRGHDRDDRRGGFDR